MKVMKKTAEFDYPTRGKNYQKANKEMPFVRRIEIDLMLTKINAQKRETIVDFGCGNGILTYPLAQQVGAKGKVIALDNSKEVLADHLKNKKYPNINVGILSSKQPPIPTIPLEDSSVDAVVTLANLHHLPDKELFFNECYRILKKGGRLVVGDVAHKTNVQRYFDGPVNKFCSTGHPYRFLDNQWAKYLCKKAGLKFIHFSIKDTPWTFQNEAQAKYFLHTIHDANCAPQKCLDQAKDYLGYAHKKGKFFLQWKLFYLIAKK